MGEGSNLERLDLLFTQIYEAARANVLEAQKQKALIVIDDDVLELYRTGHPVERFPGLRPPLYVKMKTLGHMPLAVYCLLRETAGAPLSEERLAAIKYYRRAVEACTGDLDTREDAARGLLHRSNLIFAKVLAMLDAAIVNGQVSAAELAAFARGASDDIVPVLAAAARVQLEACHMRIMQIRHERLSSEQWNELHILVLGPYMARRGQNFLQYFSRLLDTPIACRPAARLLRGRRSCGGVRSSGHNHARCGSLGGNIRRSRPAAPRRPRRRHGAISERPDAPSAPERMRGDRAQPSRSSDPRARYSISPRTCP